MSEDLLALMTEIGFEGRFFVVGHDRGGRVARRMAADHPERLVGASLLDIMPMEWVFSQGDKGYANRYWHWYFHLQHGLAEDLIGAKPKEYAQYQLARANVKIDPVDVEHYCTMFSRPHTIAASLADYRTAFEIDRPRWEEEVAAGKRIQVPLQLLWGEKGNLRDAPVLEEWQMRAISVRGHVIRESGHFIPEEQPEQVIQAINKFADELRLPSASITITSPVAESGVSEYITVQGTASNIPQDKELWLLAVPDDTADYYPQTGPAVVSSDGRWSARARIGQDNPIDIGKGYMVIATLVNQEGQATIRQYFKTAPNYSPLKSPLKGIQLISQVHVTRSK
jgi:pimeloyl-ACP methyl ester carboxylesterase